MSEGLPPLLRGMLSAVGTSGHEGAAAALWREAARDFGAEVSADTLGSSVALVSGSRPGLRLAVVGHIDEIGLMVTHIDDEGFLWFAPIGGWDAQILVGQRVRLIGSAAPIVGVIGKKPIHLLRDEERKQVADVRELHIDIGARDGEQAAQMTQVGDVAVIDGEPIELPNGRVVSRALDNRLGAYIALEVARAVSETGGGDCAVAAVAAAQEEITLAGARTSAYALEPTVAVVVDVTHATDAPGIDVKEAGRHALGSGAVIARGSTLHPRVSELLIETARAESIPPHGGGQRPPDWHARRRCPHRPCRSAHRTGVDTPALHALAGGDGRPRGRAGLCAPDRRLCPARGRTGLLRALSSWPWPPTANPPRPRPGCSMRWPTLEGRTSIPLMSRATTQRRTPPLGTRSVSSSGWPTSDRARGPARSRWVR